MVEPCPALPKVAIPTLLVWLGSVAVWVAATVVVLSDVPRWWLVATVPAHTFAAYSMFTVVHDAVHHAVGRAKWISELFGRLSLPFVASWTTLPALRYIHLEHHRNTNEDIDSDPDAWAHSGPRWQLPLRWLTIDAWYSRFYLRRIRHRPGAEIVGLVINETILLATLAAAVSLGYWWELLIICLIPQRIGLALLAWWFDWLPHHDLAGTAKTDPYRASRSRVGWERLMTPLMFCQNYHVVHHIHPRIPFYRWAKAWRAREADYLDRAVPISTAWGREFTVAEYRAWRASAGPNRSVDRQIDFRAYAGTGARTDIRQPRSTVVVTRDAVTELVPSLGEESLLETVLRAGIDVPYACLAGACTTCKAKLLCGDVSMDQNYGLSVGEVADGWILTCQSWPTTEVVEIEFAD